MRLQFLIYILTTALTYAAFGATLGVSGSSEFIAVGKPSALKIHGQSDGGLTGTLTLVNNTVDGNIKFKVDNLVTGVEQRDRHMKEKYLETKTFPEAKVTVDKLQLASNPIVDGFKIDGVAFAGQLTLHGISHPITGTIDLNTSSGITKGEGQFEIKLSDYKIDVPSYLGITVADTVTVKIHLEAKKAGG